MKPPKSDVKRVQWAIQFMDMEYVLSGRYSDIKTARKAKRQRERRNPTVRYELVKITTEPVAETKKRKSK